VKPLVSIVTPSLNMAAFIEQTIQSVLTQDYPCIEYIVVDGGSTDGTLAILAACKERLSFVSEQDDGPADAINRGFRLSHGEIFAWLNADDYYLPGALSAAVEHLAADTSAGVIYGEAEWVDETGNRIRDYPTAPFDPKRLAAECFICQPAAFLRRQAFESVGGMDPRWRRTFDYDLWIRIAQRFPIRKVPARLAASRMHRRSISLGARRRVLEETIRLLLHHYGYAPFEWVYAWCAYILDRRDQFFEPLRPSLTKYALSLPVGLYHNRAHPWRYFNEWRAVMSWGGLRRIMPLP
jgi:glycosyltransferase involved in cell wall biosynthesis